MTIRHLSQAESPKRTAPGHEVTVEDVRELMGASTPHFALQLRERIRALIRGLPPGHPARVEGEREIARLREEVSRVQEEAQKRIIDAADRFDPTAAGFAEPDQPGLAARHRRRRRTASPDALPIDPVALP